MKWLFRYKTALIDLHNLRFIISQIKKHQNDNKYKEFGLFFNQWFQLCVLINIDKSGINMIENGNFSGKDISILEDDFFFKKLNKINEYLINTLLIGDIMQPKVKKLEGTYSYTVKYTPYMEVLSIKWIIYNIIFYSCLITSLFLIW